jgi:enamine deaminase RidA (YjgF/YER057c/UK114 family)
MSAEINIYNPEELGPPMGQYTHVTRVKANEFLFVAGMLSGDAAGNVIGEGEFDVQTAQVFRNIEAALKSAGASWANVVQFTTYLVHPQDIPKFMAIPANARSIHMSRARSPRCQTVRPNSARWRGRNGHGFALISSSSIWSRDWIAGCSPPTAQPMDFGWKLCSNCRNSGRW